MPRLRNPRPVFLTAIFAAIAGLVVLGFQLAAPANATNSARPAKATGTTVVRPAAAVAPVVNCAQLAAMDFAQAAPGAPTQITSAALTTVSGAQYCEVKGGQPPQLQFDLRLPVSTWTGRYVQEGCGGYCGAVSPGAPQAATNCPAVTGNELVLATDNEGHAGSGFDALFGWDPGMRVSYAYTSEHNLDLAAKAIISAYYGHGPAYSYFDGCSDGGREALVEAERYPGRLQRHPGRRAGDLRFRAERRSPGVERASQHGRQRPRYPDRGEAPSAARGGGGQVRQRAGLHRRPA